MASPHTVLTGDSVESFCVTLPALTRFITHDKPVGAVEAALIQALPDCKRLLRWAISSTTVDSCTCEGAYLRRP